MAQTFRSGTNDVDTIDFRQVDPDDLTEELYLLRREGEVEVLVVK